MEGTFQSKRGCSSSVCNEDMMCSMDDVLGRAILEEGNMLGYQALSERQYSRRDGINAHAKRAMTMLCACTSVEGPICILGGNAATTTSDGESNNNNERKPAVLLYRIKIRSCRKMRFMKNCEGGTAAGMMLAYSIHTLLCENRLKVRKIRLYCLGF